jgi:quinoprotein relay system zinc metallohydrolase 2
MKYPAAALCWALFALHRAGHAEPLTLELREVAPGIHVHQGVQQLPDRQNRGEIANIGFIVGDRCVAVVDTGGSPEQGYALKAAVEAATKVPVCYVINTHVHPDHIYGNIAFKQPGISFLGHHKLAAAMAMRAPFYGEKAERDLGFALKPEHFVPPDQPVQDTLELDLGGRILVLKAHRTAHTDNDLSVYDRNTQTLWLADLLFMGHLPVVDGSLNGWLKELEGLKNLAARLAIPGHGPVAAEWPKALEPEERYLKLLQTEIRAAIKANKTMEQAMAEVGLSARGEWELFDEFHKRNISTAFAELEWEDD